MAAIIKDLFKSDKWQQIKRILTPEHINFLLKLSGRDELSHSNLNCNIKKTYLNRGIKNTYKPTLKFLYNEKVSRKRRKVSISKSNFFPNSET